MKRTKKNRQAGCLQTGKSERTAARAAKCVTDYDQENTGIDFRKDKGRDKPLSTFLQASEIKTRQCIYISREIHEKVAIVTSRMGNGLSIGKFVDNILRDHFRQYGQQYMEQIENAQKVRLYICNSISVNEQEGLEHLRKFFFQFLRELDVDLHQYNYLELHYNAFFDSSAKRIEKLRKDGSEFISHVDTFRKVFRQKEGITISTNHGVKGAEFDTVIAFGLLEDYVPHFSDVNKIENAKRILYVIASRARKNLYLISEQDRGKIPTIILNEYKYKY